MLTARNIIVLAIVIAIATIVVAAVSLMQTPDSDGLATDSYGTRARGQRALFELLKELHVPVERLLSPPTTALDRNVTLVLWKPQTALVQMEPAYLQAVAEWVKRGGRVVVAPDEPLDEDAKTLTGEQLKVPFETVLEALDLPQVKLQTVELFAAADGGGQKRPRRQVRDPNRSLNDDLEDIRQMLTWQYEQVAMRLVPVETKEDFAPWQGDVSRINLPERDLPVITAGQTPTLGRITCRDEKGNEHVLAASFRVGQGEVIVVGTPQIAENRSLAHADNSVLAVRLLVAADRPVVFDEFYHGLTIRGNPLWLFTRPGYGISTLCLLAALGFWIWRESVFLGPPLETPLRSRRSIAEYVDAMSRFFNRGGSNRPFVLREVRDGVLHAIRRELALPPGREHAEDLAAVLVRRDPRRAAQLIEATERIDAALARGKPCPEQQAIQLLQGISNCL